MRVWPNFANSVLPPVMPSQSYYTPESPPVLVGP